MTARKKYQVFISSTFIDMKAERQAAVEAVLAAGHIPAGMELFSAGDESQLDVIKRWIQESDIYVLILGGRYGSLDPVTQLSYTEIEYDYAVANKKPYFALYLTDDAIAAKRIPADQPESLKKFRRKVRSKICNEVSEAKDIKIALPQAIHDLELRMEGKRALTGWIRADTNQKSGMVSSGPLRKHIRSILTSVDHTVYIAGLVDHVRQNVLTDPLAAVSFFTLNTDWRLKKMLKLAWPLKDGPSHVELPYPASIAAWSLINRRIVQYVSSDIGLRSFDGRADVRRLQKKGVWPEVSRQLIASKARRKRAREPFAKGAVTRQSRELQDLAQRLRDDTDLRLLKNNIDMDLCPLNLVFHDFECDESDVDRRLRRMRRIIVAVPVPVIEDERDITSVPFGVLCIDIQSSSGDGLTARQLDELALVSEWSSPHFDRTIAA